MVVLCLESGKSRHEVLSPIVMRWILEIFFFVELILMFEITFFTLNGTLFYIVKKDEKGIIYPHLER